jgi:hypothetical protein
MSDARRIDYAENKRQALKSDDLFFKRHRRSFYRIRRASLGESVWINQFQDDRLYRTDPDCLYVAVRRFGEKDCWLTCPVYFRSVPDADVDLPEHVARTIYEMAFEDGFPFPDTNDPSLVYPIPISAQRVNYDYRTLWSRLSPSMAEKFYRQATPMAGDAAMNAIAANPEFHQA